MSSLIEARDLGMMYAGGFEALKGINIRVETGERIAVVGRSGAGKSTLLRILNRLLHPTNGELFLDGQEITHAQGKQLRVVRRRVGMVFQQFNLVSRLNVLDNVLVGTLAQKPGFSGLPSVLRQFSADDKEWAMTCLEEVEIAHLALKRATDLSGGQQQRVAIARLLAQRADVILADEPIASLDPRSAEQVMNALEMINQNHGVAVLTNLHQVDVATRFSTRMIGLRDGDLVWDLKPNEIDQHRLEELYGDSSEVLGVQEELHSELKLCRRDSNVELHNAVH